MTTDSGNTDTIIYQSGVFTAKGFQEYTSLLNQHTEIRMHIDKPELNLNLEISFRPEGIWVNGVQKDVDSEWPEIYAAFKKFVGAT